MQLLNIARAYMNKITNRLWGVAHMPAEGKKKGTILLSYLVRPFTLVPWEYPTDPHTNYWECREIARLFSLHGYAIDIINWNNTHFVPHKPYLAVIDTAQNLERLSSFLPRDCKKIMHITSSYNAFQNSAEQDRLDNLKKRRGVTLSPQRTEVTSLNPAYADFLEGLGNRTVHATFSQFNKSIYPIPISVAKMFDFPEKKDFEQARNHFLFLGGGGAVLKGLDLVVEAFAKLPNYHLHAVGPASYEKDFEQAYVKEFTLPNITRYSRPRIDKNGNMTVDGIPFDEITNRCAALIYPSASEGTSGAVVQAMHAGVIPLITRETGLAESAPVVILENPTVEMIRNRVIAIAKTNPETLRTQARHAWEWVREHHTQKTFREAYARFIGDMLHL